VNLNAGSCVVYEQLKRDALKSIEFFSASLGLREGFELTRKIAALAGEGGGAESVR
jgi:hypothetical protein